MNDSEFDRQMTESFASAAEERQIWPIVARKLPGSMTVSEWLAPLLAACLALLILHRVHTGGTASVEPIPVATIALQPPSSSSAP